MNPFNKHTVDLVNKLYSILSMSSNECSEPKLSSSSGGIIYAGTVVFKTKQEAIEEISDIAGLFNLLEEPKPIFGGVQFNIESPEISGKVMISRSALANRLNKEEYYIGVYLLNK